jgi:hypothetical protein
VAQLQARLAENTAHLRVRYGAVHMWTDNLIVRVTCQRDSAETHAAAERLAQQRA